MPRATPVQRIKKHLLANDLTQKEIGEKFGVSRSLVSNIATNRVHKDVEPLLQAKRIAGGQSRDDMPSGETRRLQGIIEKQQQQIEDMRKAKFTLKVSRRRKTNKKTFLRVIIPDTHGAHIDPVAASAFLQDLELLKPKQVVRLGDHIDCGGFLAQHHVLGFVPETTYSFAEDVAAANEFLDQCQERTGKIKDWYIVGNHEARIEKWIVKETLRHQADAEYFYQMFGTGSVLSLEKRGIQIVNRNETYHGLSKRGTIRLGKCLFHHGTRCGVHAAKATLDDLGGNIVFGHTHRISSHVKETIDGVIGAWSVGCLSQLHPVYGDTRVSNWAHGYAIQVVETDGTFLHLTIPIIEGRSMLHHLLDVGLAK